MIDGVLKVQQSSQKTKKGHKDQHPLIELLFNRCTIIIIVIISIFKFLTTLPVQRQGLPLKMLPDRHQQLDLTIRGPEKNED